MTGINDEKVQEFTALFRKYSSVPIYIFADVSDQSFKQLKIPSSNPIIVKKLIQRRLLRDYSKNDLNSYFPFKDKKENDKNSSSFVVANIANVPPLSDWLNYLKDLANPVDAVYSVPIELSLLPEKIEPILKKKGAPVAAARWKMLIIQSNVGGFRIIVTKDSQLVFSRLLNFDMEEFGDEKVVNLKNQILGTIEFLRRIGYKDKQGINVFLLFTSELISRFNISDLKGYNVTPVSEEDLTNIAYKKKLRESLQHSIELDISAFFYSKGRYLGFLTKNLEQVSLLSNFSLGLT